jgi:protein SCO1
MSRFAVFVFSIGALVAVTALALFLTLPGDTNDFPERTTGTPLIGGPFELVAHDGSVVTDESFRGSFMLIYFGFTYCPDVCPTELQVMSGALDLLGDNAEKVRPLLITIDPERDTVEAMAQYVSNFHPRLMGLSGTAEQIAAAASAYRVYYEKVEDPNSNAEYTMDHSSVVYLMDPDGSFVAHFGPGTGSEKMAEKIQSLIDAG